MTKGLPETIEISNQINNKNKPGNFRLICKNRIYLNSFRVPKNRRHTEIVLVVCVEKEQFSICATMNSVYLT